MSLIWLVLESAEDKVLACEFACHYDICMQPFSGMLPMAEVCTMYTISCKLILITAQLLDDYAHTNDQYHFILQCRLKTKREIVLGYESKFIFY